MSMHLYSLETRILALRSRFPKRMDFQAHSRWTRTGGRVLEIGKTQIRYDYKVRRDETQEHPCPYELFAGAIGSCIINTFLDLALRKKLSVAELDYQASISVQLKGRKYEVESIAIHGIVSVSPESQQIARKLMDLALEYCALVDLVRKGTAISVKFAVRTHTM